MQDALIELAGLRRKGAHGDCIALLQGLLQQGGPEDGPRMRLLHELSISHRLAGDCDASLAACQAMLDRQPGNRAALMSRILTVAQAHGPAAALPLAEQALALAPDHPPLLLRLARLLREAGRPEASIAALRRLLLQEPQQGEAHHQMALALRDLDRPSAALDHATRAQALLPDDPAPALLAVDLDRALGRPEAALARAEAALTRCPQALPLALRKGALLRQLWRLSDSLDWLEGLAARQPAHPAVLHQLAVTQRQAGLVEASLHSCRTILRADPRHPGALSALVEALRLSGDARRLNTIARLILRRMRAAPDTGAALAPALCLALPHLAPDHARALLLQARDRLLPLADALAPDQLWPVYLRADALGLGRDYAGFARAIRQRPPQTAALARAIVLHCHRRGLPNWSGIGRQLLASLPGDQRGLFAVELAALERGPDAALALRKAAGDSPERPLLVARLLLQQGRVRPAARYMGLAQRARPDHPLIFRDWIACLCGSGRGERARAALLARPLPRRDRHWAEVLAQGWAELDEPGRGMALLTAAGHTPRLHQDWAFSTALMQGGWPLPASTGLHLAPTVQGLLRVEAEAAAGQTRDLDQLTLPAMRLIDSWMGRPQSGPPTAPALAPIPATVMQYWSQGRPTGQLAQAVASWQAAPALRHRLFDRMQARDFLARRLGRDWVVAFNRAEGPTEESDFFRLCYLACDGGIYADCDDWLIGDPARLLDPAGGLTVFREPTGAIGNNLIVAPPRHPALLWAAVAARRALLDRHSDNTWGKTGPGLLTRAIARHIRHGADPAALALRILPRWQSGRVVQSHSPLPYKLGSGYWNRNDKLGGLTDFAKVFPTPAQAAPASGAAAALGRA